MMASKAVTRSSRTFIGPLKSRPVEPSLLVPLRPWIVYDNKFNLFSSAVTRSTRATKSLDLKASNALPISLNSFRIVTAVSLISF